MLDGPFISLEINASLNTIRSLIRLQELFNLELNFARIGVFGSDAGLIFSNIGLGPSVRNKSCEPAITVDEP